MHGHTRLRLIRAGKDVQRHNPLEAREGEGVGARVCRGRGGTFICAVYSACFLFTFLIYYL